MNPPASPEGEADPPALRCKALRAGGGQARPPPRLPYVGQGLSESDGGQACKANPCFLSWIHRLS